MAPGPRVVCFLLALRHHHPHTLCHVRRVADPFSNQNHPIVSLGHEFEQWTSLWTRYVDTMWCATGRRDRLCRSQIIATRPKGIRRSNPRRNSGKAQVLGNTNTAPATRARAVPASNGAKTVAPAASQQPADKIIVSNLPPDVNEAQVKVSHTLGHVNQTPPDTLRRSFSPLRLARSRT